MLMNRDESVYTEFKMLSTWGRSMKIAPSITLFFFLNFGQRSMAVADALP